MKKRLPTNSRVVATGCVGIKRLKADGRVPGATVQVKESCSLRPCFDWDSLRLAAEVVAVLAQRAKAQSRPARGKILELLCLAESLDSSFFLSFPRSVDSLELRV